MQNFLKIILFLFFSACSTTNSLQTTSKEPRKNSPEQINKPYVLLISIDGYRYDYTQKYAPPHLTLFRDKGSSTESLIPVFPSKTFPNHLSIITGLYPAKHGIISNNFFDFSRAEGHQLYEIANHSEVKDGSWYSGTPIWAVAEKNGMLAASYFWPGSEAHIDGIIQTYVTPFSKTEIENSKRVEQILTWLKLPAEKRPHFISLYFSAVDSAGHSFGTESPEVRTAVHEVDQAIGTLLKEIENLRLPINVIIVSDHGMENMDEKKVEYLDQYTDLSSEGVKVGELGPHVFIYSKDSKRLSKIYGDLKKVQSKKPFKVYYRKDIPRKFHYSANPRIGDIMVIAQSPWAIGIKDPRFKMIKGNHGYDPQEHKNMRGIFYATGPGIKESKKIPAFENIHIYPFILDLLGLPIPKTIDGSSKVLKKLRK